MKKGAEHKKAATTKHPSLEQKEKHQVRATPRRKVFAFVIILLVIIVGGGLWLLLGKGATTMDNTILAKVNGEAIDKSEVDTLMLQAQQQGLPLTNKQILEQMIAKKLLLQEAKKQKITIEEAAIGKYIEDLKALIGQPLEPLLTRMGITEEQFRQQIREQLTITSLLEDKQRAKEVITDDEIKVFYAANEDYFLAQEQVRASHILVAAEEEAKEIIKQLKNGADFAKLAKEKSIDPSAKGNAGDLGFFGKGQMVPEFENAAFTLNINEVSEPVKSQFGYHVIKVHEKKKAGKITLEEAKEDIRGVLQEQKAKEAVSKYVQELLAKAKVERFTEEK